mmetsp:Transcript_33374/g.89319  ORF Transcript_33374/g.89319 Transcript_33374/m.89319 type:complete len:107 (+) Transcript_33374:526-846(+)
MHCARRLVCARPLQSLGQLVLERADPSVSPFTLVNQECLEVPDGTHMLKALTTITVMDLLPTEKLFILWKMDESGLLIETVFLKGIYKKLFRMPSANHPSMQRAIS